MGKKRVLHLMAAVAVLGACGGRSPIVAPEEQQQRHLRAPLSLPEPPPAAPAYSVAVEDPLETDDVRTLEEVDGVAVVAPLEILAQRVEGPERTLDLDVALVDSLRYRPLAPPTTRDAEFVWAALVGGRAVVTFETAERLGVDEAGTLELENGERFAIGAVADFSDPPVADVLLDTTAARSLASGSSKLLMVGAESGAPLQSVKKDIARRLDGARFRKLLPTSRAGAGGAATPSAREPVGGSTGGVIPPMLFRALPNGFVDPDDDWVAQNISTGSVPILGTVTCHRIMFDQLAAALSEIEQAGLAHLIRPGDYGGCYVPRFIDRDPTKPLSMHAFGLAFDINVSTNGLGTRGDVDPRIVEIFERWGFAWGGLWSRPDPMHFELARVVSPR